MKIILVCYDDYETLKVVYMFMKKVSKISNEINIQAYKEKRKMFNFMQLIFSDKRPDTWFVLKIHPPQILRTNIKKNIYSSKNYYLLFFNCKNEICLSKKLL